MKSTGLRLIGLGHAVCWLLLVGVAGRASAQLCPPGRPAAPATPEVRPLPPPDELPAAHPMMSPPSPYPDPLTLPPYASQVSFAPDGPYEPTGDPEGRGAPWSLPPPAYVAARDYAAEEPAAQPLPGPDDNRLAAPATPTSDAAKPKPRATQAQPTPGVEAIPWGDGCAPSWAIQVELLGVQRREANPYALIVHAPTAASVIDAAGLDFDYELGVCARAFRNQVGELGWELAYSGIPRWSAARAAAGDLQLDGPGFQLAVNPGVFLVTSRSLLHSAEVNAHTGAEGWPAWFVGFRYIHFADALHVSELNAPIPDALGIDAANNLFGVQVGSDFTIYDRGGAFRIDARAAVGTYAAHVAQSTSSSVLGPAVRHEHTHVAYSGELALNLTYRLTERLFLRGGYRLLGVGAIALAPDQVAASDLSTGRAAIHLNSTLFDGGHVGIQYLW